MKTSFLSRILALVLLLVISGMSRAQDIDLFSTPMPPGVRPNILIILDNSANWSATIPGGCSYTDGGSPASVDKKMGIEQCALYNVIKALPTNVDGTAKFNIGLMLYDTASTQGGKLRYNVTAMTAANKLAFMALIKGLDILADKANNAATAKTMYEAWTLYTGKTSVVTGVSYGGLNPITDPCQKSFVIYLANGKPQDTTDAQAATLLANLGGSTSEIAYPLSGPESGNYNNEFARFMFGSARVKGSTYYAKPPNIVTYTIAVTDGGNNAPEVAYRNNAESMALSGGGKAFVATDANSVAVALQSILDEIQAVNSVFASATLPVSVSVRGEYLNQVYMGVFRPDANRSPRWFGNLKQYKLGRVGSQIKLIDASTPAVDVQNVNTGFVSPSAKSFWTHDSTFWDFSPRGTPPSGSDNPDGEVVEKGAAAQQLREALNTGGIASRKAYTCVGCTSGAMENFDSANAGITNAMLGIAPVTVNLASAASKTITELSSTLLAGGSTVPVGLTSKRAGGSCTATGTTTADHGFTTGSTVIISGTGNVNYDGPRVITVSAAKPKEFTFSQGVCAAAYPAVSGNVAAAAGSEVTAKVSGHGFKVGEPITIAGTSVNIPPAPAGQAGAFNSDGSGSYAQLYISSVVDADHFKYLVSTAAIASTTAQTNCATSTACKATLNKATATTTNHGFGNSESITISGAAVTGYNGNFVISYVDDDTFTYYYTTVAAPLGASSATATSVTVTRANLIDWVRGRDLNDENNNALDTDCRASVHGDVLHSRPLVVNYGGDNVYVYYGANDGTFRAIKGGQAATDGKEQWAFIAEEHIPKLKSLYAQTPLVGYDASKKQAPRPYFFDGAIGSYIEDTNLDGTPNKVHIFPTMRRGGRFIYALDVTSPTSPTLLWKKGCPNKTGVTGCSPGYDELGQTWSEPKATIVRSSPKTVLIFGGGYDAGIDDGKSGQDAEPAAAATMGRAIYIVDASNGTVLKKFDSSNGIDYPIAADVTILDTDFDGKADRVYAADLGGNVWRLDIDADNVADYKIHKLASVNGATDSYDGTSGRKFLFAPDVVYGQDENGLYDAVLLGSGDREHPLKDSPTASEANKNYTYDVKNRFYMFKDRKTGKDATGQATITEKDLYDTTDNLLQLPYLPPVTAPDYATRKAAYDAAKANPTYQAEALKMIAAKGWMLRYENGEQTVSGAITSSGTTFFNTNQPTEISDESCQNLGVARQYHVSYANATATIPNSSGDLTTEQRFDVLTGGGFPPTPIAPTLTPDDPFPSPCDPKTDPACCPHKIVITGTVTTDLGCIEVGTRFRTYWYEKMDDDK